MTKHIATIAAYPIKATLGGGFRGAYLLRGADASTRIASERFETIDEARNWVKAKAWELHPGCRFAAVRRAGEYLANIWVDA